jgi:2-polyprenyl-3-methyl-5-hydroxy-6-metoxy-1,4-benzoquinol methylase
MASVLKNRSQDLEIMDDLLCTGEVVDQTLRELEIINRLLGGNSVTVQGIRLLLKTIPSEEVSIADLGCGGGDILKKIADWAAQEKLSVRLTGVDANPGIISFAANNTKEYSNIQYEALNIFSEKFRQSKFDIVVATLFMHHFSNEELIDILKSLKNQARIGIVVNDIHRHWIAYHSIRLLTKFFSKSAMVRFDAPLSVLRAFNREELKSVLRSAGFERYRLRWKWAFRWQLVIPMPQ